VALAARIGLFWLLPSSTARSLRILIGTSLDDCVRIRSDCAVRRVPSQLPAIVAGLATRAMSALRNTFRPSGVGSGFVADLTRSRAELITENALLRQQLVVASAPSSAPPFASTSEACSCCSRVSVSTGSTPCCWSSPRRYCGGTGKDSDCSGGGSPARAVHANRVSHRMSSPSSTAWRPRTGSGEPNGFGASS
jgi:hypothetical protein